MIRKFIFRNKLFIFAFFIFMANVLFSSCQKTQSSRTEVALGTVCTVSIFEKTSSTIYDRIFEKINQIENLMNTSIPNSEISKINQNAGIKPVKISSDTFTVLSCAKEIAKLSDGAFEPTIGNLVELWNINAIINDETGSILPQIPSQKEIENALSKTDFNQLVLDKENQTAFLKKSGMKLDVGGIAKGYATDCIVKILQTEKVNRALIDLGGNIFAFGYKDEAKQIPWKIGIKNPQNPLGNPIEVVECENSSIVTSGIYERFFEYDGEIYHHLLSAKTGFPENNDLLSVSIICNNSMLCDALSTACFILGKEKGSDLIKKINEENSISIPHDFIQYVFVLEDGTVLGN